MADEAVTVVGMERAVERLDPGRWAQGITAGLEKVGVAVVERARENLGAHAFTGGTAGALTARVEGSGLNQSVTVDANSPGARTIEFGRHAGSAQPPTGAIAGWLSSRGGDASNAFVTARAIGRRGIRGEHFLFRAIQDVGPTVAPTIAEAVKAKL